MKKKITALLLCVITALSLPVSAFADNADELVSVWKQLRATLYGKEYVNSGPRVVTNAEDWQKIIQASYRDLEDSITINIPGFDEDVYDIKKLKNYDVSISASGQIVPGELSVITYSFDYNPNFKLARAVDEPRLFSRLDIDEKDVYNKLTQCTRTITSGLSSDFEKETAIHNFITDNFTYGPIVDSVPQSAHSVVGFVKDGQGICEAYANTFYIMCKIANLDVSIITGTANNVNHMWNLICLDGEYYHVDVTNDDPAPDVPGAERYNYFNLTDDIISKTHSWERSDFPACTSEKYNYYNMNKLIIHSEEELKKLLDDELKKGNTAITFRTEEYEIKSPDVIKSYIMGKGFNNIQIKGEYNKESTYNITLR